MLTLNLAGDNWVRQGGYSDQEKDTFDVYRGIRDITGFALNSDVRLRP